MFSNKRLSVCLLVCTAVTVAALLAWPATARSMRPLENSLTVKTARAVRKPMERTLALAGTLAYGQERYAIAQQSGIAAWVTSKQEGQPVQKGEALLRLDTTYQEALLTQSLMGQQPVLDLLKLGPAEQALQLENTIHQSTIRAYDGGQVLQMLVRPGEAVQAGAPIALLASCSQEIRALIGPAERSALVIGLPVRLESNGVFVAHGRITHIGPLIPNEQTGLSAAQITITPSVELPLTMGESLEAVVLLESNEHAVSVPLDALDDEGHVWQVHEGRAWKLDASPLWLDEQQAWFKELEADAVVVLSPFRLLQNGQRVKEADGF